MNKNIFFCSNTQPHIFPNNTRTSFHSYIDINHLDYIEDRNISAAIKSITFEHNLDVIEPSTVQPHIIIICNVNSDVIKKVYSLGEDQPLPYDLRKWTPSHSDPEFGIGRDYVYTTNDHIFPYGDEKFRQKKFTRVQGENHGRNFTDIQIHLKQYKKIIHNIYLDRKTLSSIEQLLDFLVNIFPNINSNYTTTNIKSPIAILGSKKDRVAILPEYDLYFNEKIGEILGIDKFERFNTLSDLILNNRSLSNIMKSSLVDFWMKSYTAPEQEGDLIHNSFIVKLCQTYNNYTYSFFPPFPHSDQVFKININKLKSSLIGIRSNLSQPDISNNDYDSLVSFIDTKSLNFGVHHIEFKNPIFYKTTKEKLSRASFDIIDIDTKEGPKFSLGVPTYIQVSISSEIRMTKQFSMFLDSSDTKSKKYFPDNHNMDFTICLPERLQFNRRWQVALKTILIPTRYFNIYDDSCWINVIRNRGTRSEGVYLPQLGDYEIIHKIPLISNRYVSKQKLGAMIKDEFIKHGYEQIECSIKNDKFIFSIGGISSNDIIIMISPFLAKTLGFSQTGQEPIFLDFYYKSKIISPYKADMQLLSPRNLLVLCDVVDDTIFGAQHVKLMKLITSADTSKEMVHIDFLKDEFVGLGVREFSNIRIRICDTTGSTAQTNYKKPVRLQIVFAA